ncbi:hypothetical protein [Nonomuraea ceibae]|uniref:hypothetical protein n=1 Tax=Nonomuraea ceibae TaxID=1935170 RepID=UPI001C5DCD5D|nr:hypothetical protein [Nonomuraea ceibae]
MFFDWFNTAPGTGWRLGGWLYAAEGHPLSGVAITWYDGDGVQISRLADERPLPAGVWTYGVMSQSLMAAMWMVAS